MKKVLSLLAVLLLSACDYSYKEETYTIKEANLNVGKSTVRFSVLSNRQDFDREEQSTHIYLYCPEGIVIDEQSFLVTPEADSDSDYQIYANFTLNELYSTNCFQNGKQIEDLRINIKGSFKTGTRHIGKLPDVEGDDFESFNENVDIESNTLTITAEEINTAIGQ